MPNYQNGKIYKITSPSTDKIYVGSTIQTLNARFQKHLWYFKGGKTQSSNNILKYKDCIINLIEEYPCNIKRELLEREQFYMNLYRNILVDQRDSFVTYDHKLDKKKIYHYKYKEKHNAKSAKYREDNKESVSLSQKKYYKLNKEKINERNRNYREKNKEEVYKKQKNTYDKNKEKYNENRRLIRIYTITWGGDKRSNNNLLEIDTDLFD